jgi:hypothetical protein
MRNIHFSLKRSLLGAIIWCLPLFVFGQTEISSEAGLRAIANDLNGSYKLTADITLTTDWTPLGTFKGTLDGDGHIISGLYVYEPRTNQRALFSITEGATIRNVGFENAYVNGDADAAVIIGQMKSGLMEKCYVANSYVEGRDHVASFVGRLSDGAVVQDSYANAHIHSRSFQAGGLIGVILNTGTKISKCYFSGIVRSSGARPAGIVSLVDADGSTIEKCVNLSPYILGPSNLRIVSNSKVTTLSQNYSLGSTLLGSSRDSYDGNPITNWSDSNYGVDKGHGANIGSLYGDDPAANDEQAKLDDLYKNKLGWDFDNTWKITPGSYPVLKWQTAPVKTSAIRKETGYGLKSGAPLDLSFLRSAHGLDLTLSTTNPNITITGTTVTAGTITAFEVATVQVSAPTGFQSTDIKIALFPDDNTEVSIATQEELDMIRYNLSGKYKLTADIALTGYWSSISTFTGTFDGNAHIISGLKINYPADQQGLFGKTTNATVKRLGIENAYISGNAGSGPIIGEMNNGLLEECYVANTKVDGKGDHTGGLVGRAYDEATIRDCYSTAYLTTTANQGGGLTGCTKSSTFSKCYFSGIVRANKRPNGIASIKDDDYVTIEYCVNLAPYLILGNAAELNRGGSQCRIVADRAGTLTGNYSLESTKLGTSFENATIVPADDPKATPTGPYGGNITAAQAKSADFYSGINWDMTNKWQVLSDGYPVLKWQTAPVKTSILNYASPYSLASDATLDLSALLSSHGINLAFTSQSAAISITDKVVSATSGAFPPADVTVDIAAVAGSDFQVREDSLTIAIFPAGIIDIGNVSDFLLISQYPDMNYRLTADLDLSTVTTFSGIGTAEKPFKGTFDGNGHIISGATIEDSGTRNIGLFRVTENATIKRLGVENARFVGNEDVGGIVGKTTGVTTIEECYVSNSYIEGRDHVASIVGGLNDGSIIRNSYATARVHSREHQAGGLSGTIKKGLIENSYYSGVVSNAGARSVGVGGYHDDGSNTVPENIQVKNSVNLSPYILGTDLNAVYRIFDNNGDRIMLLTNNYSLSTSVVGKPDFSESRTVPEDDDNYGSDKRHGANVSPADAKKQDFYATTLGWDFSAETGVWKITEGSYPVLKWQTAPVANSIYSIKNQFVLKAAETIDLGKYAISSHGLDLTFSSIEDKLTVTNASVAIKGTVEAWSKDTLNVTKPANADFAAATGEKISFTLFPETTIPIADEEQLAVLQAGANGDYILTANITLTNNWTPAPVFTGTLTGNGHTISGLKFTDSNRHDIGLFSKTNGATIRQLGLKNAHFVGNENIGAFVGTAENTTIQECFVENSYVEARDRAGAIAGKILKGTKIENSYAASSELKAREHQVGGLVGASAESPDQRIYLSNVYFAGTIVSNGGNRACGILGLVDNNAMDITIENSVNLATSITGGGHRYRITDVGGNAARTLLDNNYSLAATIVGEAVIATDDANYGAEKMQGENIPDGDGNAKTKAFYTNTLGWDFDNTWGINEGNAYPILSVFYSGDATLSALNVTEGAITPTFSASVTEYALEVENDVEAVTVQATANHEKATVAISGNDNLQVGVNTITITVTAENFTTKVYTIVVTRKPFVVIPGIKAQEVKITTAEGRIQALFEGRAAIKLYSATGQLMDETNAVNKYEQSLKSGIYILSVQGKVYKAIVK